MLNVDANTLNEIKKVQNSILKGDNYFRNDILFWEKYFKNKEGLLVTREHVSAGICSSILKTIKGNFILRKDDIGSCWISDCDETTLHERVCASCKYSLKCSTFRKKLNDIDTNSVSRFSLPFSTIFD